MLVVAVPLLVGVLGMAGCSPNNQGALTLDPDTGRPVLVLALCEGEGVTAVRLTAADTSGGDGYEETETLWRIEADHPRPAESVTVGEAPDGFVETVHLAEGPLPAEMVLVAEMDGGVGAEHGEWFELEELQPGILLLYGRKTDRAGLEREALANCDLLEWLGLPRWFGGVVAGALMIGGGVAYVVVLARLIVRGRRARRSHHRAPPLAS